VRWCSSKKSLVYASTNSSPHRPGRSFSSPLSNYAGNLHVPSGTKSPFARGIKFSMKSSLEHFHSIKHHQRPRVGTQLWPSLDLCVKTMATNYDKITVSLPECSHFPRTGDRARRAHPGVLDDRSSPTTSRRSVPGCKPPRLCRLRALPFYLATKSAFSQSAR